MEKLEIPEQEKVTGRIDSLNLNTGPSVGRQIVRE